MGLFKKEEKPIFTAQLTEAAILQDLENQLEHANAPGTTLLASQGYWTTLLQTLHDYLNHPTEQAYSGAATTFLENHEDAAERYNERYPATATFQG